MKPKPKSKLQEAKQRPNSNIKEEIKSGNKSIASTQSKILKPPQKANRLHQAMTNLGIPKLRDSKYTVRKFAPVYVDSTIREEVRKFSIQNDTKRDDAKGQLGDLFLKYSSPSIIDDKHSIMKRKALKIDLASGISSDLPEKHRKWPYDYRPTICKQIAPNELQTCLNKIFPPKEWTADGEDWHQSVSAIPAARKEVIDLRDALKNYLKVKNSKVFGLCSIRLDLYLQCFDELIRQVTICCLERGLIMAQVRDTIKSTLWSYHTVYESCCALGLRKTLNHEEELLALSTSITNVLEERNKIREKIADMEKKIESVKEVFVNHSNIEESKHTQRMILLQKANDQIKDALLSTAEYGPKKKKAKVPKVISSARPGRAIKHDFT